MPRQGIVRFERITLHVMKIGIRILFLVTLVWIPNSLTAQVTFNEQSAVKRLMEYYVSQNRGEHSIDGWRIKIVSTTDRRELERAKGKFEQYYPKQGCIQDYEAPYYSLKYGAFETRLDVEPMLVQFKRDFPNAIPFRDKILKSELFD